MWRTMLSIHFESKTVNFRSLEDGRDDSLSSCSGRSGPSDWYHERQCGKGEEKREEKFCQELPSPSRPITDPPILHCLFQFTHVINNIGNRHTIPLDNFNAKNSSPNSWAPSPSLIPPRHPHTTPCLSPCHFETTLGPLLRQHWQLWDNFEQLQVNFGFTLR